MTFRQDTPGPHRAYAPDPFAAVLGGEMPLRAPGLTGKATVIDIAVAADGQMVDITIEVADESLIAGVLRDMPVGLSIDDDVLTLTGWISAEPAS